MAATTKDYADPVALLEYDPAGLVIRATGNPHLLDQLDSFSTSLKYYVDMMKGNSTSRNTTAATANPQARREQEQVPSRVASASTALARRPPKTEQQVTTTPDEASSPELDSPESSSPEASDWEESEKAKGRKPAASRKRHAQTAGEPHVSEAKVAAKRHPAGNRKIDTADEEPERNSKRVRIPTNRYAPDPPAAHRLTRSLAELLVGSPLQHSAGVPRKLVSQNFEQVGLQAKCAMKRVVSKHGKVVSHLIFRHDRIDFRFDQRQNFVWRVEDGSTELSMAALLDPSMGLQQQPQVPVFLATVSHGTGHNYVPTLLHYMGHYQCTHFERKKHVLEGIPRQEAILEFKFVAFDRTMAKKMAELAAAC